MRAFRRYALALALLFPAAPAAAQGRGEGPPPPHGPPGAEMMEEERRPFELLLRARRELELSDAQVGRLQDIALRLDERNRPLRARLAEELERYRVEQRAEVERELVRLPREERPRALRRMMEERRQRGLPPHMRPLAEEMRRNIQGARAQAQRVLTPRQKAQARALLEEYRRGVRDGRARPGARRPMQGRRPGIRRERP